MPVLRQPHDHHRDFHARLRAETPTHAARGNQDRHVMMPSSAIDARPDTRSQPAVTKLASLPRIHQRSRHQSRRATPRSLAHTDVSNHAWPQADRGNPYNPASASPNPRQNPHSARGTAPAYVPRFRALALFGRRPQERVEGFVMPASKNLHNNGRHATFVKIHGQVVVVCPRRALVDCSKAERGTRTMTS